MSLLQTATTKAFLDAVMMIIDDYREYLTDKQTANKFEFDKGLYFKMKGVQSFESSGHHASNSEREYEEMEFYHVFCGSQSFEEVKKKFFNLCKMLLGLKNISTLSFGEIEVIT